MVEASLIEIGEKFDGDKVCGVKFDRSNDEDEG